MLTRWAAFSGGFLHPIESVTLPVLDLDPVLRPAALVGGLLFASDESLCVDDYRVVLKRNGVVMIRLVTRDCFTHNYAKGLVSEPEDREPAVRKLAPAASL